MDEASTIQFVKSSHKWGKWFYPRKFATTKNYEIEQQTRLNDHEYSDVPDIENEDVEILKWACEVFSYY